VVVPENKEKGFVEAGNNEIQVIHGKIPGAKDQIRVFETFPNGVGVHQGIDLIGDTEYLHRAALLSMF
jgi:hypothetical protein